MLPFQIVFDGNCGFDSYCVLRNTELVGKMKFKI